MTNEELDEARAMEAGGDPVEAARLAREGWTPPEPVDPDLLAWREWVRQTYPNCADMFNNWELDGLAEHFIAGARMAREKEQERAKELVEFAELRASFSETAAFALDRYRGERND